LGPDGGRVLKALYETSDASPAFEIVNRRASSHFFGLDDGDKLHE
jgi:hypothetical protein